MGRHDGILRSDHRVLDGEEEVARAGLAGIGAREREAAAPAPDVRAEREDERGLRNEGLVVAGGGEASFFAWSRTTMML